MTYNHPHPKGVQVTEKEAQRFETNSLGTKLLFNKNFFLSINMFSNLEEPHELAFQMFL